VRRETGKEKMVQVHYGEGIANHTGIRSRRRGVWERQPLEHGLGAGLEQQIEEWFGRSERQWVQLVEQGEDNVKVVGVAEVALLGFEPSPAGPRLALVTAP